MKSQHEGLWKAERQGWYSSKTFSAKELPEKFKVIMRYNKFRKAGNNAPNFIFAFTDSVSAQNATIEFAQDGFEEIMQFIWWVQDVSYYAEINGEASRMKSALYDIDMCCRAMLDKYDPDQKYA